jgi:hypothetical protein
MHTYKAQDLADAVWKLAKTHHEGGQASEADVLQAKALLLEAKIEVLREEQRASQINERTG